MRCHNPTNNNTAVKYTNNEKPAVSDPAVAAGSLRREALSAAAELRPYSHTHMQRNHAANRRGLA